MLLLASVCVLSGTINVRSIVYKWKGNNRERESVIRRKNRTKNEEKEQKILVIN